MIFAQYVANAQTAGDFSPLRMERYADELKAAEAFASRLTGGNHVFPWAVREATQEEVTGVDWETTGMALFRDPWDSQPCGGITVGDVQLGESGRVAMIEIGGMWTDGSTPEMFLRGAVIAIRKADHPDPECTCGFHGVGEMPDAPEDPTV